MSSNIGQNRGEKSWASSIINTSKSVSNLSKFSLSASAITGAASLGDKFAVPISLRFIFIEVKKPNNDWTFINGSSLNKLFKYLLRFWL